MPTIVQHTTDHRGMRSSTCPKCKTLFAYWEPEDLDENGNLLCHCDSHNPQPKPMTRFDCYEIRKVAEYNDGSCEPFEEPEDLRDEVRHATAIKRTFWTLYGHTPNEGVQDIADRDTFEDIKELYQRITGCGCITEGEGEYLHLPTAPYTTQVGAYAGTPRKTIKDLIFIATQRAASGEHPDAITQDIVDGYNLGWQSANHDLIKKAASATCWQSAKKPTT